MLKRFPDLYRHRSNYKWKVNIELATQAIGAWLSQRKKILNPEYAGRINETIPMPPRRVCSAQNVHANKWLHVTTHVQDQDLTIKLQSLSQQPLTTEALKMYRIAYPKEITTPWL